MKKIILFVITILAIGFSTVSAQSANEALQKITSLVNDFSTGKISQEEYLRLLPIYQAEYNQVLLEEANRAAAPAQRDSAPSSTYTQAQLNRLEELYIQWKLLQAGFNEGRVTRVEYERQYPTIEREIENITAPLISSSNANMQLLVINDSLEKRWPGTFAGWPQADAENGYRTATKKPEDNFNGIGPLRQGAGTTASFSYMRDNVSFSSYTIYQTGATAQTLADMKQQIETMTGQAMIFVSTRSASDHYTVTIPVSKTTQGHVYGWDIRLFSENDRLTLVFAWAWH